MVPHHPSPDRQRLALRGVCPLYPSGDACGSVVCDVHPSPCAGGENTVVRPEQSAAAPWQHCCHWNAPIETRPILLLTDMHVAPSVLAMWGVASIAILFARSDSAPDVHEDALGRVEVALNDLALPLVYGVPAAQ